MPAVALIVPPSRISAPSAAARETADGPEQS